MVCFSTMMVNCEISRKLLPKVAINGVFCMSLSLNLEPSCKYIL